MPFRRATGRYKETKFYRVGKGVGFARSVRCPAHTTSWSAPVPRVGALILVGPPLEFLPYHRDDRFSRSTQEPGSGSRYLYAGCHPSRKQVPLGLILESYETPQF